MAIKVDINTRLRRDGQEEQITSENIGVPPIVVGDKRGLVDMSRQPSIRASACIYCGSTEQLSDEHIVPYGLGGDWQIYDGSCELCRRKTQRFEGLVIRGELSNVRRHLAIHSRSGHSGADETISILLTANGREFRKSVPLDAAPILLSFPTFEAPGLFANDSEMPIRHTGWQAVHYGYDLETFLKEHGATGATINASRPSSPVALAQMIAKIAYAYAWVEGALEHVDGAGELVEAMLDHPENLGTFVGMQPPPNRAYAGVTHRLQFSWHPRGLLIVEVQLFADAAAPTYIVTMGRTTLRGWRRARRARKALRQNAL